MPSTVHIALVLLPAAFASYVYLLYPAMLWLLGATRSRAPEPVKSEALPTVAIVVVAYNEARSIGATLDVVNLGTVNDPGEIAGVPSMREGKVVRVPIDPIGPIEKLPFQIGPIESLDVVGRLFDVRDDLDSLAMRQIPAPLPPMHPYIPPPPPRQGVRPVDQGSMEPQGRTNPSYE